MFTRIVYALGFALAGSAAVAQQFVISTFAGAPLGTTPVAAASASIGSPQGVATDAAGNVYFSSLNSVFKLDSKGTLTRVAGNLHAGYSGDGGPAINAQLFLDDGESRLPVGLAVDGAGNLYIADRGNARVRRVSSGGIIATVAGGGAQTPIGLALDSGGNLYMSDAASHVVRKLSPVGIITTVAGNGNGSYSGDGGPATSAGFGSPAGLAVDSAGNLFIADAANGRVRRVSSDGIISTVAGNGRTRFSGDGGPAIGAQLSAEAVSVDSAGNLYIADPANRRIRKVSLEGTITTVAGTGVFGPFIEGGPATDGRLGAPSGVAVDSAGNLYIADNLDLRIRKVSPNGNITTVAGNGGCCNYGGDGGSAASALFSFFPWGGGLAAGSGANLYIADSFNNRIRKITADGIVTTVAGNGICCGHGGDGGPAISAQLSYPLGVAVDSADNLYIADTHSLRVRKVSSAGIITTVPVNNATDSDAAALFDVRSLAVDRSGNLYVAGGQIVRTVLPNGVITDNQGSQVIRKIAPDGTITTLAQVGAFALAVDSAGNVYAADINNPIVRKVSADGIIATVAGNGTAGFSGDGGPATSAQLNVPAALAVDDSGNLYIADTFNLRVRKVSADGIITTVAGAGGAGYSGDGGPAMSGQFGLLSGLAIDSAGNLYAADQSYNVIRLLQPASSQASGVLPR